MGNGNSVQIANAFNQDIWVRDRAEKISVSKILITIEATRAIVSSDYMLLQYVVLLFRSQPKEYTWYSVVQ